MKLHVLDMHQNGVNGHLTAHLRIIEDRADGSCCEGVAETYGIDPLALRSRFGSIEKWLAWAGQQMKRNHCCRTATHADLHTLKGTMIDLGN